MIEIDCSTGEGGGGILRAALPLSVALKIPIHLKKIRPRSREKGIGWQHKQLIEMLCTWTGAIAEGAEVGSTELVFCPANSTHYHSALSLDFDDQEITFEKERLILIRDYEQATEYYTQSIVDANDRGVRGHAVTLPLIAIFPILANRGEMVQIELRGGTEVPGAPFIDALELLSQQVFQHVGLQLELNVHRRGCFGVGGGLVKVKAKGSDEPRSYLMDFQSTSGSSPHIDAQIFIYGDEKFFTNTHSKYMKTIDQLMVMIGQQIRMQSIWIPYRQQMYQQLFLIRSDSYIRDVTVCYEELPRSVHNEFGINIIVTRLLAECKRGHLMSRFLVEQVLPVLATARGNSTLYTEKITNHTKGIIDVVERMLGRNIKVEQIEDGVNRIVI